MQMGLGKAFHKPHWAILPGTDAVEPVVGCDKITTWIPHNGTIELFERFNYIAAKTILIRERVSRVIDAAVDTATHVPDFFCQILYQWSENLRFRPSKDKERKEEESETHSVKPP